MEKIHPDLENQINVNQSINHKVIITLTESADIENLPLQKYIKLMDNVLSAELNGNEIFVLAKNSDVLAIEPDAEMKAF